MCAFSVTTQVIAIMIKVANILAALSCKKRIAAIVWHKDYEVDILVAVVWKKEL